MENNNEIDIKKIQEDTENSKERIFNEYINRINKCIKSASDKGFREFKTSTFYVLPYFGYNKEMNRRIKNYYEERGFYFKITKFFFEEDEVIIRW
jgi:hypothetical protein